jgi:ketosteroid isomerase-like protein
VRSALVALTIIFAAAPVAAFASDKNDVMAVVQKFVDGYNKKDIRKETATCAPDMSIIDEFAPYYWHGPKACARWANDGEQADKATGTTNDFVTLGTPLHVDVTGDRAYVVVPSTFSYDTKGKKHGEPASTWTLTLRKASGQWLISAWAWTKRSEF